MKPVLRRLRNNNSKKYNKLVCTRVTILPWQQIHFSWVISLTYKYK